MTLLTHYVLAFSFLAMTLALPTNNEDNLGKRADSDYVRFGKRSPEDFLSLLQQAIREEDQGSRPRRSPDSSYVRFGKRSNIRGITPYSGLISLSECSRYRDYAAGSLEDMIFLLEEEKQCLLSKL